jgi:hypothetical protein
MIKKRLLRQAFFAFFTKLQKAAKRDKKLRQKP